MLCFSFYCFKQCFIDNCQCKCIFSQLIIIPFSTTHNGHKKKTENDANAHRNKCGYNNNKDQQKTLFLSQMQTNAPSTNSVQEEGASNWTDSWSRSTWRADGPVRSNFPRWLRFVKRNDENANDIRTHEVQLATMGYAIEYPNYELSRLSVQFESAIACV